MSFHLTSQNIHIRQEGDKTSLLCDVRDLNGNMVRNHIHLDDHIGNSDGWFLWGGVNFTQSASNVALENTDHGPKLTADLPMSNGGSRGRQGMFLADKIKNENGRLRFLGSD